MGGSGLEHYGGVEVEEEVGCGRNAERGVYGRESAG